MSKAAPAAFHQSLSRREGYTGTPALPGGRAAISQARGEHVPGLPLIGYRGASHFPGERKVPTIPLWWQQLLLVMCGGALGAAGRHWMSGFLLRRISDSIPWGTLAVNLIGSFAVGFLAIWLEGRGPSALYWRAFLIVGLLGGLTTYSSLMLESLLYVRTDRSGVLLAYLAVTLVAGLALVWLGSWLAAVLRPEW